MIEKMIRKAASSAIQLTPTGIAAKSSHEFGKFTHPLSLFSSNLHNLGHKHRRGSSKPKIDFSTIKDVDDAICLFRDMLRMRPLPSILVYTNLLSVIVKMKHYSVALYVFDEMRRIGAPVDEYTRGSPKPKIDFSTIKDVDDAICLFRDMLRMRPQPSILVYNNLLSVVVKMKHHCVALSVFDEMRRIGAPVNEYTFNIAVNCYCLVNRVDFGFGILGIMFKSGNKPDVTTFGTLLKWLFLDDKVAEAEKLFKKLLVLELCDPNDVMILTVINGLCKAGGTIPALELLHVLEKTRWKADVKAHNAVIDGLCKGGMVDDALQLLSQMRAKSVSPDVFTYNPIIQGLCDVDRWEDVEEMLGEMDDYRISKNVVTFNILVDAYCKEGRVKDAEDVLKDMMQQKICPDMFTYNARPMSLP
ncbi:hypothetical protein ACS0TY_025722 [Phlomoides rotata]